MPLARPQQRANVPSYASELQIGGLARPGRRLYLPATPAATRQVVEPVRSHPYFPGRSVGAPTVLHPDGISAREAEDQEREWFARVWVCCARLVAASSSTLSKLRLDDDGCLLPLFVKSAPNTLRRHLSVEGMGEFLRHFAVACRCSIAAAGSRFCARVANWDPR